MTFPKVAVAMSGGVDSSVAALLLQQAGYDVIGITMQLTDSQENIASAEHAASVAVKLGIGHLVVDLSKQFQTNVVEYFCESYREGRTPNPCIACNRLIKFGTLLEYANSLGASFLATGHYARVENTRSGYHLFKGFNEKKDQSYFLYRLDQSQLSRLILPIGELTKHQVRQLAADASLPTDSKESQDICFLTDSNYASFLGSRFEFLPGEIINEKGEVLGHHQGIATFTVGQRHGLGVSSNAPLYVTALDAVRNRITVGDEKSLFKCKVQIEDLHWISGFHPDDGSGLSARIRYRMADSPIGMLEQTGQASATIQFVKPVRAVTPGQSLVFYRCDEVLGGGIITG